MIWPAVLFTLTFAGSLAMLIALVVLLPERYFAEQERRFLEDQSPALRVVGVLGKNLLGIGLIMLGVLLSLPLIPGQGLVTIAIGLMLLDVPGKRRVVRRMVQRRGVLRTLNGIRKWFGRPAFRLEE